MRSDAAADIAAAAAAAKAMKDGRGI